MCGIGGILFSEQNSRHLEDQISRLNKAQLHRGPDDQQIELYGNHAFCHERLSLIDQEGGKQPFHDTSGRYLIVYNGEVYNYKELRKELGNYPFRTRSDTEVVLAAFITWGEKCLQRFNGMFSFLIWDHLTETGFAARDPAGVKPFVYTCQNHCFIFASELKAILAALIQTPKLNPFSLCEFLVVPSLSGASEDSMFEGIKFLGPGENLRISARGLSKETYYSFRNEASRTPVNIADEINSLGAALEESVRLSLRADNPLCIFLSGGLDSSLIAAMACRHGAYAPEAFTIQFQDHGQFDFDPSTIVNSDDLPFAHNLAAELGLPFNPVLSDQLSLTTALQEISTINDRVPAWEQELSQYFLSKAASHRFKAVLVGDAADETNFGYFFLLNTETNYSPAGLIRKFGGTKRATLLAPSVLKEVEPLAFLEESYVKFARSKGFEFNRSEEERVLAMSAIISTFWLGRLMHNGDIHTMHHSLEGRVPFANLNMLQAAARTGPESGFRNGTEKYLLKEVSCQWLPPAISKRKKSALPRDPRMGSQYQEMLKVLLKEDKGFAETFLNHDSLSALCKQKSLDENDRMMLFNCICLLNWSACYVN